MLKEMISWIIIILIPALSVLGLESLISRQEIPIQWGMAIFISAITGFYCARAEKIAKINKNDKLKSIDMFDMTIFILFIASLFQILNLILKLDFFQNNLLDF